MLGDEIISYSFFKFSVWTISILWEYVPILSVYVRIIKISKQEKMWMFIVHYLTNQFI